MNAAYWGIPPLFALIIYKPALDAWFQNDDFVWLNLVAGIHSWQDLWYELFHPTIHGTWRPLGERVHFLILESLFGYSSAVPFRIVTFLGQFANMALVSAITLRLTRSVIAGFLAPVLWMASDKLALTMTWSSNINYVAAGFFILAALWFLLRHIETNRTRDLAGMWVAFLLGLCALEMTVVMPVMAAVYTGACARRYFKKTLPLIGAAALFAVLHFILAPNKAGSLYRMHFDIAIFRTLAAYWQAALIPDNLAIFTPFSETVGSVAAAVFTIALLGYAGYQAVRRNLIPLVFLAWFVLLLLPVLPLRDHFGSSYLGLPLIGLAMLAADGLAAGWRSGPAWRAVALALFAFFLLESPLAARKATKSWASRSWAIHGMMTDVAKAHRLQPDRAILLQNVDDTLFWAAIYHRCFLLLGLDDVFLAPGSDRLITPHPEIGDVAQFIMPAAAVKANLNQGRLAVYSWERNHLEEITDRYVAPGAPLGAEGSAGMEVDRVDVADPQRADRLESGWYSIDGGLRWMARRASLRMKTAGDETQELHVSGYCPAAALRTGPVRMTVTVNGAVFPVASVGKADAPFEFVFPLAKGLPKDIQVAVEMDRTFRMPPDQRDLGLAFGVFEIKLSATVTEPR